MKKEWYQLLILLIQNNIWVQNEETLVEDDDKMSLLYVLIMSSIGQSSPGLLHFFATVVTLWHAEKNEERGRSKTKELF